MGRLFHIESFDPARYPLLGEGVWGRVYDLGDGTVLKIAREKSAGIGSGREKIEREYAALGALAGAQDVRGLIPRALGKGDVPANASLAAQGFSLWLRMEKISGKPLTADDIECASEDDRQRVGESCGRTLARLHKAMQGVAIPRNDAGNYNDLKADMAGNAFYLACIAALEQETARIPAAILCRPAHNDYNISNILFQNNEVCGILDFAEWGAGFPEKDISDVIREIPCIEDHMIRAYERESGFKVDSRKISVGLAENALYGAAIEERRNNPIETAKSLDVLIRELAKLGYKIPAPERAGTKPNHQRGNAP